MLVPRVFGQLRVAKILLNLAAVFVLLIASAQAQVTASIQGVVKDTSGAVVPEATVTVKQLETS